jgi:hypothetical protein
VAAAAGKALRASTALTQIFFSYGRVVVEWPEVLHPTIHPAINRAVVTAGKMERLASQAGLRQLKGSPLHADGVHGWARAR